MAKDWAKDLKSEVGGRLSSLFAAGTVIAGLEKLKEMFHEIETAAERLGVSTDYIQNARIEADKTGAGAERLTKGLETLAQKAGANDAVFAKYKISLTGANGELKTTDELFADLSEVISKTEESTKKIAIASEFLGNKIGAKLVPMLQQGREAMEHLNDASVFRADKITIQNYNQIFRSVKEGSLSAVGFLTNMSTVGVRLVGGLSSMLGVLSKLGTDTTMRDLGDALEDVNEGIKKINSNGGIFLFSKEQQAAFDKELESVEKLFEMQTKQRRDNNFKHASPQEQENILLKDYLDLTDRRIAAETRLQYLQKHLTPSATPRSSDPDRAAPGTALERVQMIEAQTAVEKIKLDLIKTEGDMDDAALKTAKAELDTKNALLQTQKDSNREKLKELALKLALNKLTQNLEDQSKMTLEELAKSKNPGLSGDRAKAQQAKNFADQAEQARLDGDKSGAAYFLKQSNSIISGHTEMTPWEQKIANARDWARANPGKSYGGEGWANAYDADLKKSMGGISSIKSTEGGPFAAATNELKELNKKFGSMQKTLDRATIPAK